MATTNPMVPTVSAPLGMGYEQSLYRGLAQSQLYILQNQLRLGNLNMGRRVVELANGVVIECIICFNKHDIYVHIPPAVEVTEEIISAVTTGLIFHPRTGQIKQIEYRVGSYDATSGTTFTTHTYPGVSGGWENGIAPLSTDYLFPLVDEDNASFVISSKTVDGELSGEFVKEFGNYGNLYWWNGHTDNPVIVSWKGTPTRHFPLGGLYDIPGFTRQWCKYEHPLTGDSPHYTSFGAGVYQQGIAINGPRFSWPYEDQLEKHCLVVGAAVCQGKLVIAAISARRTRPQAVVYFSDGTMVEGPSVTSILSSNPDKTSTYSRQWDNAFQLGDDLWFIQLWQRGVGVDGWKLLSEAPCTEAETDLPWYADKTGTQFTCSNGSTLTASGYTASVQDKGSFVMVAENDKPTSVAVAGEYAPFNEGEETVSVTYNVSGSTSVVTGEIVYKDFSDDVILWLGTDPEVTITGPSALTGTGTYPDIVTAAGQTFTASGGTAPFSWSAGFAHTVSGDTSSISTSGGDKVCGVITVTVTDACGKTASLTVRGPNGQWVCSVDAPSAGLTHALAVATAYCGYNRYYVGTDYFYYTGKYRYQPQNVSCSEVVQVQWYPYENPTNATVIAEWRAKVGTTQTCPAPCNNGFGAITPRCTSGISFLTYGVGQEYFTGVPGQTSYTIHFMPDGRSIWTVEEWVC